MLHNGDVDCTTLSRLVSERLYQQSDQLFVKFQFKSVAEAKSVATIVALVTARPYRNVHHFLRFATREQVLSSYNQNRKLLDFYEAKVKRGES